MRRKWAFLLPAAAFACNLIGNHPPMQMDGTYGMTGGMSEKVMPKVLISDK